MLNKMKIKLDYRPEIIGQPEGKWVVGYKDESGVWITLHTCDSVLDASEKWVEAIKTEYKLIEDYEDLQD